VLVSGFDWDSGNWPKCGKHGVSKQEIEAMFLGDPIIFDDPCPHEARKRAIGQVESGRWVFAVYVMREIYGCSQVRPLSARYMHQKEIAYYAGKKA